MGKVVKKKTASVAVSKLKKPLFKASNVKKTNLEPRNERRPAEPNDKNVELEKRNKPILSSANKVTKKKDRMKLKKESLKKKLIQGARNKKEEAAKKNREKAPVVGDMKPLTESLKNIHEFLSLQSQVDSPSRRDLKKSGVQSNKSKEGGIKIKQKPMKQKARKAQFQRDLQIFSQVKKHPEFLKDPMAIISTHIENKMLLEASKSEGL